MLNKTIQNLLTIENSITKSFVSWGARKTQLLTCRLKSIPFCSKSQKREKQLSQVLKIQKFCSVIIKLNRLKVTLMTLTLSALRLSIKCPDYRRRYCSIHMFCLYITLYRQNLSSELINHRDTTLFQTSYDIMLSENRTCYVANCFCPNVDCLQISFYYLHTKEELAQDHWLRIS